MRSDTGRFAFSLRARVGLVASLLPALIGGCDDSDRLTNVLEAEPLSIVSDPAHIAALASATGRASNQSTTARETTAATADVAYASLSPETVPDGVVASIRNRRTGSSVLAGVVDGGFDPVSVEALVGDLLEILVTDSAGATLHSVTSRVPAKRPPRVVRSVPPRGKRDVPLNSRIVVVFSEPVDPQSLTASSIRLLRSLVPVGGQIEFLDADRVTVAFVPDELLTPATQYQLVITQGIRDLDGDPLEAPLTIEFETGSTTGPPAASRIAFVLGSSSLAVMNADATGVRVLTKVDGSLAMGAKPTWSPDGTKIAFAYNKPGARSDIYVINADGSGLTRLTDHVADDRNPAWSPDGTRIAFNSYRDSHYDGIYVMNDDGSEVTRLTTSPDDVPGGGDWGPAWSPDGTRIAFSREFNYYDGIDPSTMGCGPCSEIHVMSADGSAITQLIRWQVNGMNQAAPAWSPDGTQIAYAQNSDVFVMNADGSGIQRLTNHESTSHRAFAWRGSPTWSPDGRTIAYTVVPTAAGSPEIFVVNSNGSRVKSLLRGSEQPAWWIPPGRR